MTDDMSVYFVVDKRDGKQLQLPRMVTFHTDVYGADKEVDVDIDELIGENGIEIVTDEKGVSRLQKETLVEERFKE